MISGLKVTLALSIIIWSSGIVFGSLLGVLSSGSRIIAISLKTFTILLSGIPAMVFLFWMHYPLQTLLNVVWKPFNTAALTLSVINTFLVADLVRGSIKDFPQQYYWSAKVCGMTEKEINIKIKLPILLRQIIPGLLIIQITMLQSTLFASLISVDELFRTAQRINSIIYKPVEIYTILALFFIIVCVPLYGLAYYLRSKYTRDLSEN